MPKMTAKKYEDFLDENNACLEARIWSRGKTPQRAWKECRRPDWMIWLLEATLPEGGAKTLKDVFIARLKVHLRSEEDQKQAWEWLMLNYKTLTPAPLFRQLRGSSYQKLFCLIDAVLGRGTALKIVREISEESPLIKEPTCLASK